MAGKNEIRVDVNVTGEDQAARDLKKVERAAEATGEAIDDLGTSSTEAAKKSEDAGAKLGKTAADAGHLRREVDSASKAYKSLVEQLDKTGDTSLKKDIRAERKRLREAQSLLKDITPGGDDGGSMVARLAESFRTGSAALKGAAVPALVGVGAAAAPLIGATVQAAVLGGVGIGGIVGGVALAADDPAVRAAATKLSANIMGGLQAAGQPFAAPLVDSLERIGGLDVGSQLAPGLASLTGEIAPLTAGVTGLADNALPGLNTALKASAPIVRTIAHELPELGSALSDMFETVAEDPDGAIMAMKQLFDATEAVVVGIGNVTAGLSKTYEWTVKTTEGALGWAETLLGWVPLTGDMISSNREHLQNMIAEIDKAKTSTDGLKTSTEQVTFVTYGWGDAARDTADNLDAQRKAMTNLVDAQMGIIHSTIQVEDAIDGFTDAVKENGKSLDINYEQGRANTEQILRGIEAVKEGAQREYDLARQHGATAQEAEAASKAYRDKYIKALEDAAIKAYGNTKALQDLFNLLDAYNGKTFSYTLIQKDGVTIGAKVKGGTILAGLEGRATGGRMLPGRDYMVGENGIEIVRQDSSGATVLNNAQTRQVIAGPPTGAAAGTATTVTVRLVVDGGDEDMKRMIRKMVKVDGGGSVQVAFGEN